MWYSVTPRAEGNQEVVDAVPVRREGARREEDGPVDHDLGGGGRRAAEGADDRLHDVEGAPVAEDVAAVGTAEAASIGHPVGDIGVLLGHEVMSTMGVSRSTTVGSTSKPTCGGG